MTWSPPMNADPKAAPETVQDVIAEMEIHHWPDGVDWSGDKFYTQIDVNNYAARLEAAYARQMQEVEKKMVALPRMTDKGVVYIRLLNVARVLRAEARSVQEGK